MPRSRVGPAVAKSLRMARAEGLGEGAAAVEASRRWGGGWWREAGVLDRLRLRNAPVVARARVRCVDALRVGSLVVIATEARGEVMDLWGRVVACTPSTAGLYDAVLDLLGEPAAETTSWGVRR